MIIMVAVVNKIGNIKLVTVIKAKSNNIKRNIS